MSMPGDRGKGNWSIQEINDNFKPTFENRSKNMYSTLNPLEGTIKKSYKWTGKEKNIETHLSFAGGFGSGRLPKANNSIIRNQKLTPKRVYGRSLVEREGLKAASNSQGSYQQYLKFPIQKCVENYTNQCGRILFGDGTGVLGRGDGTTAVTGLGTEVSPFVVTFDAKFKDVNFEEKAFVQVVTNLNVGDNLGGVMEGSDTTTNLLEIVEVLPATRQVKMIGVSPILTGHVNAPAALPVTSGFVMQRSYLNEPTGLASALFATSSFQGIDIQRRWKAGQIDADGSGIMVDMINEAFLERNHVFGEEMNMIVCRYNQYQKILAQLEEKKSIQIQNVNVKGHLGFKGIQYTTSEGKEIAIVTNRFADADKVYLLNTKYINRIHRPDFGWFDEDGTVFMRVNEEDEYEARYGGYWEHAIVPTAQAVIHDLAI